MAALKIVKLITLSCLVSTLLVTGMYSDLKNYAWTYQYDSLPAGSLGMEMYFTAEVPKAADIGISNWGQWLLLGYGITNSTDAVLYQKFLQENNAVSGFKYEGFKLRLRHKAGKKDSLPVDFLFYVEYERSSDLTETDIVAWNEVIAKDIDKFNISYNMIFEYQPKNNWRYVHKYALGLSYEILDNLRIAFEATGSYSEKKHYLGPTISLLQPEFRINFGPQWGQNDSSNFLNVRLILGFPFQISEQRKIDQKNMTR